MSILNTAMMLRGLWHMPLMTHSTVRIKLVALTKLSQFLYPLGLNDSMINDDIAQAFNSTTPFRLENFTYSNHKLLEIIFRHLENTSFKGVTVIETARILIS